MSFPDAQLVTLAALRDRAADEATYGTKFPDEYPEGEAPALPYVVVRAGPTSLRWPVLAVATMRLTAYADTEAEAVDLAWRLARVLLDCPGNAALRSFGADFGPVPASDPDTGAPLCSFTVAARLRPTP
ncbi:hypothetical protein [Micromonospora sp. NPDC023956]|uniref:hypothetical protein n=1 Tax=Micromonospora sp. NPDC023956 TaxID=3155722 RepID=UPI00340F2CA5